MVRLRPGLRALIAELRASRKVVELAFRAARDANDPEWLAALADALAPLVNVRSEEKK